VALLVIAAATVLAYSSTFDASFHLDDFPAIVRNATLRDPSRLWPPYGNRDLGVLSFALNYGIGGLEPFGYHLANLAIHVGNALLVWWLAALTLRTPVLRRMDVGPLVRRHLPFVAGLLFAVHPIQTQAVTYIVQRFASLATLFYLLSVCLYARSMLSLDEERPSIVRAASLYGLSLVSAVAAMRTKEISFTLPLAAAVHAWLFFRPRPRRFLLLVPLAAIALLVPLGLVGSVERIGDAFASGFDLPAETEDIPRSVYLWTESRVVVTYLRLLVLPIHQNLDYDYRLSRSLADREVLLAFALLVAVAAVSALVLVRSRRANRAEGVLFFFGVAWFFVALSVESSFIPIRDVIFEHRVYLPSAGALIALATALLWSLERLRLRASPAIQVAGVLAITAGPLGAATFARNAVWKDDVTLWRDVVAKSPEKARGHVNLGVAYQAAGRWDEARSELLLATRLDPADAEAHDALGAVHQLSGTLDDAIREHREAIRLDPGLAVAHANLAKAYQAKGLLDDAIREHREAIELDPSSADAHYNLGLAYDVRNQLEDAIREYREAIRLAPELARAHANLGAAYHQLGRLDEALREHRRAIQLDPGLARPTRINAARAGGTGR
jgi:tetratricopeptide (TPR) repeat protein